MRQSVQTLQISSPHNGPNLRLVNDSYHTFWYCNSVLSFLHSAHPVNIDVTRKWISRKMLVNFLMSSCFLSFCSFPSACWRCYLNVHAYLITSRVRAFMRVFTLKDLRVHSGSELTGIDSRHMRTHTLMWEHNFADWSNYHARVREVRWWW